MKITTQHPASSYGVPVIIDDTGNVMDYAPGISAARRLLGWSTQQFAERCDVSRRTVEGWESGRMPDVASLNVLADALRGRRKCV